MKMLKIILPVIASLILLGIALSLLNYYFYSWTSFVQPFGCEYKYIHATNKQDKLEQKYDLRQIASKLRSNPQPKFEVHFSNGSLGVSRKLGNVKYNIGFQKHNSSSGKFTKIDFHNFNFELNNKPSPKGEPLTTPNYHIKSNIFQMINEMPLNDIQKKELKEKVQISCSSEAKLAF